MSKKQIKTHGGARPNAGRKPSGNVTVRKTIYVPPYQVAAAGVIMADFAFSTLVAESLRDFILLHHESTYYARGVHNDVHPAQTPFTDCGETLCYNARQECIKELTALADKQLRKAKRAKSKRSDGATDLRKTLWQGRRRAERAATKAAQTQRSATYQQYLKNARARNAPIILTPADFDETVKDAADAVRKI